MYGFALWWECELVPGITLSTSPHAARTHWEQLYLPLREPLGVQPGDGLEARLSSDTSSYAGIGVRWRVRHERGGLVSEQSFDIARGYLG